MLSKVTEMDSHCLNHAARLRLAKFVAILTCSNVTCKYADPLLRVICTGDLGIEILGST